MIVSPSELGNYKIVDTLETASEFAAMLTAADSQTPLPPGLARLSAREQELVTLVAKAGRTDAQVAGQLHNSVRIVRSHLDRIRDKSACRRRADLTRLAVRTGLV